MTMSADAALAERSFLSQYRRAAIRGTLYAALMAAVCLSAFLLLSKVQDQHSFLLVAVRVSLICLLLSAVVLLLRFPDACERHYVVVAGGGSAVVLGGTVCLLAASGGGAAGSGFLACLFGLFLHYAFLRLPLWCAAGIGWTVSAATAATAILVAPQAVSPSSLAGNIIYLVMVNLVGMVACRSIESRERELFAQRRIAEESQQALNDRALAAEESHTEVTRLLAAVSHDLRQPMMAASAYLAVLRRRVRQRDCAAIDQHLTQLSDAIAMLGDTLDHLLTAVRYGSGSEPVRLATVDLGPVLVRLRDTFAAEASEKNVALRVRMPVQRVLLFTDPVALWRVLMNLVSNAIKFTEPGDRPGRGVLVRASVRGDVCRIDVVDTGIGIAERHRDAIWRPYVQLSNPERSRARGLGLGLFLVRRAVDLLPGHALGLRSREGRGTRMTLRLPVSSSAESLAPVPVPSGIDDADLAMLAGAYVLVIEDDPHARQALLALLDDWGVLHASGATLDELLADFAPDAEHRSVDAIVTDYRLPDGQNGLTCIGLLRAHLGDPVPAVVVTGEPDLDALRRALPPDTTLLPKPFDPCALLAPLRAAVLRARRAEAI